MSDTRLDEAIEEHLAALRSRDLEAYAKTLAGEVVLILPSGRMVDGKEAVVALHREMFADDSWRQQLTLRRITLADSTGWVLIEYHLVTVDADGWMVSQSRAYFTLTYALRDDRWLIIADQNTSLPLPAARWSTIRRHMTPSF
ncbi:nuclear transport factor 2 family protein [Micromonospora sp. NBC_00362]|uniref:YybH family protein n=1 Tax=Micromonospora sp. NBC_00362 TaxID=2975975 RepID=UPI0022565F05|nr:nuclear transport factor 2 family protein [Micromonospora sp. NBC_00362]MCX5121722.1 nuclear transport factor 2 family protein [Micromonospora sp. NBC_00362]